MPIGLAEDEGGALLCWQVFQRGSQGGAFGELRGMVAASALGADEAEGRPSGSLSTAFIQRKVGGDAKEPGVGPLIAAQSLELAPRAEEDLLREIIRRLFIAADTPEVAEDGAFVALVECLEIACGVGAGPGCASLRGGGRLVRTR